MVCDCLIQPYGCQIPINNRLIDYTVHGLLTMSRCCLCHVSPLEYSRGLTNSSHRTYLLSLHCYFVSMSLSGLTAIFPGGSGLAGTRTSLFWIYWS